MFLHVALPLAKGRARTTTTTTTTTTYASIASAFKPSLIAPSVVDDFLLLRALFSEIEWKWPCHQHTVGTSSRGRRFEVFIDSFASLFASFFFVDSSDWDSDCGVSLAGTKIEPVDLYFPKPGGNILMTTQRNWASLLTVEYLSRFLFISFLLIFNLCSLALITLPHICDYINIYIFQSVVSLINPQPVLGLHCDLCNIIYESHFVEAKKKKERKQDVKTSPQIIFFWTVAAAAAAASAAAATRRHKIHMTSFCVW